MEKTKQIFDAVELFIKNYDNTLGAAFSILAVFLGGWITYIVTSKNSRKDFLANQRLFARDNVIVPLCIGIEYLLGLNNNERIYFHPNDKSDCSQKFLIILNYLTASKRIHLSDKIKERITYLQRLMDDYDVLLNNSRKEKEQALMTEVEDIIIRSKKYPRFMDMAFGRVKSSDAIIEEKLFYGNQVSYMEIFNSVILILNDDPENTRTMDFSLSDKISYAYSGICSGYVDADDFDLSDDEKMSLDLYGYLVEACTERSPTNQDLSYNRSIIEKYDEIFSCVEIIKGECHREIDKVKKS